MCQTNARDVACANSWWKKLSSKEKNLVAEYMWQHMEDAEKVIIKSENSNIPLKASRTRFNANRKTVVVVVAKS